MGLSFGFQFGFVGSSYPSPIIQCDFTWYSFDPDTGFLVSDNGTRLVKNEGNINMINIHYMMDNYCEDINSSRYISNEGV